MLFGILFGAFFIMWGISIIAKSIYNIDLPVVKPMLAALLIIIGASMIYKTAFHKHYYITFNY